MEVIYREPKLPHVLPCIQTPPHKLLFFWPGIGIVLFSFQDRRSFPLRLPIKFFSFPPCLSLPGSHNYWQIADFPSVGLTDNWLNSSLEVSVRHKGRRGAEGVGFWACWKIFYFFPSEQKVHMHSRLHIPFLPTRNLYACMCGERVSGCVWETQTSLCQLQIQKLFLNTASILQHWCFLQGRSGLTHFPSTGFLSRIPVTLLPYGIQSPVPSPSVSFSWDC